MSSSLSKWGSWCGMARDGGPIILPIESDEELRWGQGLIAQWLLQDDRERNSEIIKFLSNADNVSVAMRRLAVGDYIVDHRASLAELL